jgi:hypothetical protein
MSHPLHGARPLDPTAGFPEAAALLHDSWRNVADRGLVAAVEHNPELRTRVGDLGLQQLLADAEVVLAKLGESLGTKSAAPLRSFTEHATPVWRRRRISMDDVTDLYEGLRIAVASTLTGEAATFADAALSEGIAVLKWHRRLGGDLRKRNRILAAIYKGA